MGGGRLVLVIGVVGFLICVFLNIILEKKKYDVYFYL